MNHNPFFAAILLSYDFYSPVMASSPTTTTVNGAYTNGRSKENSVTVLTGEQMEELRETFTAVSCFNVFYFRSCLALFGLLSFCRSNFVVSDKL